MICLWPRGIGHNRTVTEHQKPTDAILDRLVYAPLGLVGELSALVPDLAEKGRVKVSNARLMGQFAVQMGQAEASRRVGALEGQVRDLLVGAGIVGKPVSSPAPTSAPTAKATKPAAARPKAPASTPDVASLAIPDYDSLAASQVVARLAGLQPTELQAVHEYERAKRGRKTILGKIAQLQS